MYDQVLKFGAMIVDNLRVFKQPVFIFIPPRCELRGGAWVVVDPTINPEMMEMYADENSRGGVLEPEGTVEIKFRKEALRETMVRLDPEFNDLTTRLKQADLSPAVCKELQEKLDRRFETLRPMYHQVAVEFADLHDTPGRMKGKNCISDILKWKESRAYLYWRLKRRMAEETVKRKIKAANSDLSHTQITFMMRRWFFENKTVGGQPYLWEDNKAVASWILSQLTSEEEFTPHAAIRNAIHHLRLDHIQETVKRMGQEDPEIAFHCALSLLEHLTSAQKAELVHALQNP